MCYLFTKNSQKSFFFCNIVYFYKKYKLYKKKGNKGNKLQVNIEIVYLQITQKGNKKVTKSLKKVTNVTFFNRYSHLPCRNNYLHSPQFDTKSPNLLPFCYLFDTFLLPFWTKCYLFGTLLLIQNI